MIDFRYDHNLKCWFDLVMCSVTDLLDGSDETTLFNMELPPIV